MKKSDFSGPIEDRNGFCSRFRTFTNEELVEAFNREVRNEGWVRARAEYLYYLGTALQMRGMDCSAIIHNNRMNLSHPVILMNNRIILLPDDPECLYRELNLN